MHTEYGTSYNSYILKADDGVVLFETSKAKTYDAFMKKLAENMIVDDNLLFPKAYYDENNITLHLNTKIEKIVPSDNKLV